MYKQIEVIAEVKTRSPFGYTSEKSWDELFAVAYLMLERLIDIFVGRNVFITYANHLLEPEARLCTGIRGVLGDSNGFILEFEDGSHLGFVFRKAGDTYVEAEFRSLAGGKCRIEVC